MLYMDQGYIISIGYLFPNGKEGSCLFPPNTDLILNLYKFRDELEQK